MRLIVQGEGSLELPMRLLNLLAQQGAVVTGAAITLIDGDYRVEVDACAKRAELIAEKARAMVLVDSVELSGA